MYAKAALIGLLIIVTLGASAGRWDIGPFFLYGVMHWLAVTITLRFAAPDLIRERLKPPSDRDRNSRRIAIPLLLGGWVVAGMDVGRFGWSHVPALAQGLGFPIVMAGLALIGWTLIVNPYASSAIRIQSERRHEVVTGGPYQWVRHPMYLGVLLHVGGSGPALGSWWATLPLLALAPLFIRRTRLEERMLEHELQGYLEYERQVRWRIIPGVF